MYYSQKPQLGTKNTRPKRVRIHADNIYQTLLPTCNANKVHLILLPIERGGNSGNCYEAWSPALRKRIIKILGSVDVFENVVSPHCLPDYKFSEIRWNEDPKSENPDTITDDEILQKFQFLTN